MLSSRLKKLSSLLLVFAVLTLLSACEAPEPRKWSCTISDPAACIGGWVCHPDVQPPRCGPPRVAGEPCLFDNQCSGICLTARHECGEAQPPGAMCERREECKGTDLDCLPGADGRRRCVVVIPNGRCEDDSACPLLKVCRQAAAGLPRTCLPPAGAGDFCDGLDSHCQQGLVCGPADARHQAACGIPLGRSCDPNGAERCIAGAGCYGDVCRSKRTYSQSCEALDQCTAQPPYLATCSFDSQGRGTCTLPSGGIAPADGSLPCPSGHVARPDDTGTTRCIAPGGPHSACAPDRGTQCAAGLECLPANLDRASGWACLVSLGRDCVGNPGACQEGAVCRPSNSMAPALRSCLRAGQVGDGCTTDAHCAGSALLCSSATHQCKVRDFGECERTTDCQAGRYCVVSSGRAICRLPGGLYAECQESEHCGTSLQCERRNGVNQCRLIEGAYCGDAPRGCLVDAACYANICRTKQDIDGPCSADELCKSGFCAPGFGVCKVGPLPSGAECKANGDCASRVCAMGRCN